MLWKANLSTSNQSERPYPRYTLSSSDYKSSMYLYAWDNLNSNLDRSNCERSWNCADTGGMVDMMYPLEADTADTADETDAKPKTANNRLFQTVSAH